MNVIDDPGHYLLSPRFTSLLRIYTVDYPLEEDLIVICVAYLEYFLRVCRRSFLYFFIFLSNHLLRGFAIFTGRNLFIERNRKNCQVDSENL